MVIFNSYVKLPEGIYIFTYYTDLGELQRPHHNLTVNDGYDWGNYPRMSSFQVSEVWWFIDETPPET